MACIGNRCTCENKWDKMNYSGEPFTTMGEMPLGGSWPLNFFRRTEDGRFETSQGQPISFKIKTPDYFDKFWQEQLNVVIEASNNITPEQKVLATYWGTGTPQKQLVPILQKLIDTYKLQVVEASKLYDLTMSALNDAAVICWHFKYLYQVPRAVQYAQDFTPFLATPQHPSYPAGHSVIPGCFIGLMAHFFPGEREKLFKILEECSYSRLYAGVHYPLDISEGNRLGLDIADKVIATLGKQSDAAGATVDRIWDQFKDAPIYPTNHQQVLV